MEKSDVLKSIGKIGVVAVVRAENEEQAAKISDACVKAGITSLEITFTVPGAADLIKQLCGIYKNSEVIIGAGTVLDPETARAAILAGAQFVVSPLPECGNGQAVQQISGCVHAWGHDHQGSCGVHGIRRRYC